MAKTFRAGGLEWNCKITAGALQRIDDAGIKLFDEDGKGAVVDMQTQPQVFAQALWAVVHTKAPPTIKMTDFIELLDADAIGPAYEAFFEGLADFFRKPNPAITALAEAWLKILREGIPQTATDSAKS